MTTAMASARMAIVRVFMVLLRIVTRTTIRAHP